MWHGSSGRFFVIIIIYVHRAQPVRFKIRGQVSEVRDTYRPPPYNSHLNAALRSVIGLPVGMQGLICDEAENSD